MQRFLPPFYETISSTRIRASVRPELGISMLVAPVVADVYLTACTSVPGQKDVLRREAYFKMSQDEQTLPQAVRDCMRGKKRRAALLARPARLLGWAAGRDFAGRDLA